MTLPDGAYATWSLQVFKNNDVNPLFESEQIFTSTIPGNGIRISYAFDASDPANLCGSPTLNIGWSSKDPMIGEYLAAGDIIYSDPSLTTAENITGYVAQNIPGYGLNSIYPVSSGQLQNNSGVTQC
jgi:hypothetical protein